MANAGGFGQTSRMSTDSTGGAPQTARIASIDALRGFVMFTMIFVNDLAGAPKNIVPDWMAHFSDRHKDGSGMTFVDLVFPAFLFIVGMSIPFALGPRLKKGDSALENDPSYRQRARSRCWRWAFSW